MDFWERLRAMLTGGGDPSLKDSIQTVLEANTKTYRLRPGAEGSEENPFLLDPLTVMGRQLPGGVRDYLISQSFREPSMSILPAMQATPPDRAPNPQAYFERTGYMPSQRPAHWDEGLATWIFNSTDATGPTYYNETPFETFKTALGKIINTPRGAPQRALDENQKASEDAWAMFLGLPQAFGSFEISPYQPTIGAEGNQTYFRPKHLWDEILRTNLMTPEWSPNSHFRGHDKQYPTSIAVRELLSLLGNDRSKVLINNGDSFGAGVATALAHFTLSRGEDDRGPYISIYDKWDLDRVPFANQIGAPFAIYDRLYYDPETFEPIRSR